MARILVVDDDGAIRTVVRFTLEMAGHRVALAGEGVAAIEAMDELVPDLIVLDLMMPRMDGLTFLEELERRPVDKRPPVIVLSARIDMMEHIRTRGHGMIEKPFSPRALTRTVAETLAAAAAAADPGLAS